MQTTRLLPLFIAVLGLLSACSSDNPAITDCQAKHGVQPVCTFHNPEDIELLPDRKTLLISQMGLSMAHADQGSLVFFNTQTQTVTPAFPLDNQQSSAVPEAANNWGASDCPGNPGKTIAPHGIALRQRDDNRWQVAAVNHGGRESIEMFELLSDADGPRLEWRGCVIPQSGTYFNDVALLRNGGFVASHMFDKHASHLLGMNTSMLKAMLGSHTGYVLEWQPASGFRVLEESYGAMINGVELSADDQHVFANVYFGDEIKKLDRVSGKQLASATVTRADNLAWDDQGRLLVVAHGGNLLEQNECISHPGSNCVLPYSIIRIDPQTMHSELLLTHAGAPMGAGTVARQVADDLYIGSFSGDRIVKLKYPDSPQP